MVRCNGRDQAGDDESTLIFLGDARQPQPKKQSRCGHGSKREGKKIVHDLILPVGDFEDFVAHVEEIGRAIGIKG